MGLLKLPLFIGISNEMEIMETITKKKHCMYLNFYVFIWMFILCLKLIRLMTIEKIWQKKTVVFLSDRCLERKPDRSFRVVKSQLLWRSEERESDSQRNETTHQRKSTKWFNSGNHSLKLCEMRNCAAEHTRMTVHVSNDTLGFIMSLVMRWLFSYPKSLSYRPWPLRE